MNSVSDYICALHHHYVITTIYLTVCTKRMLIGRYVFVHTTEIRLSCGERWAVWLRRGERNVGGGGGGVIDLVNHRFI